MEFPIAPEYKAAISRQYEKNLSRYPMIREEVSRFLNGKDKTVSLCLQYLYGHMAAQDLLSFPPDVFASYAEATLDAFRQLEHLKTVPAEIFFPYVLYHRVNSEYVDGSRSFLLAQLVPYIRGKTMKQAALAVNYWCYAHATYTPADDRTLGPLGVLNRTLGRCGEESVLAVAALRSVGIPARQCYCPRWSHCDDNHAWVEVWFEGDWHYFGACEPEPVPDRGWFTAAASRAMLVDTKCWADWTGDSLYQRINCLSRYTNTRVLTVQVRKDGVPIAGARVRFQVINYSELYTLWEAETDIRGFARFETGLGDLLLYARHGEMTALEEVDLRQQTFAVLELKADFPKLLAVDLVPPEDSSGTVPYQNHPDHNTHLSRCEAHLANQRAAFFREAYLRQAGLNAPQIQSFLADDRFPDDQKSELLSTLRIKDFVDITHETMADALTSVEPAIGQYPPEIFRDYILAPRVADEMLLPERMKIRSLFPQGFADPEEILRWMRRYMQCLPKEGIHDYYPSAFGCLRCRQVPTFAFDMVYVSLCRAFCFPAKLDLHTGKAQWLDRQGNWHSIYPTASPVELTLRIPEGTVLHYFEHFTLGLWNGSDFTTLRYPELTLDGSYTFRLQPGFYRLTVTTRQIDGTVSAVIRHLTLAEDMAVFITPPKDQTPERLKEIPLALPDGPLKAAIQTNLHKNLLLIFANPGSEPTEHLLREMLEYAKEFRSLPCRILLLADSADALVHPTIQLMMEHLPEAELLPFRDSEALAALHRQMRVGDLRQPFVVCVDKRGRGIFADANYRIRMARTLLNIQKLLADPQIR